MTPDSGDHPDPAPPTTPASPDSADAADAVRRMLHEAYRAADAEDSDGSSDLAPLKVLTPEELEAPLPEAEPPEAHAQVIEGYDVLREISRGGQAVVFEAVKQSTGRHVAIKVIFGGPWASDHEQARFEREADVLAALQHPNIVGIIDRGRTGGGSLYLVMDFVPGPTLDEYVASLKSRPGGVDLAELLALFVKIADAVFAAHQRGVVHRDLKPSNIRIHSNGEPCLLDFGLARPLPTSDGAAPANAADPSAITATGQFVGSLAYASPEQAEGKLDQVGVRSDVYSLGVMLYRMVTGRFPYAVVGPTPQVLQNILTAEPTPPSRVLDQSQARSAPRRLRLIRAKSVPRSLEAVVLKALKKRPDGRYADAGELAGDLRSFLKGLPTAALRQARRGHVHRWAAVLVVLLGTGVVSMAAIYTGHAWIQRLAAQPSAEEALRAGTVRWRGHSYLVVQRPAAFNEAVKTARQLGGHLMVVNDEDTYIFLTRLIQDTRKRTGQHQRVYWWLGMLSDGATQIQSVDGAPLTFNCFPRAQSAAAQMQPVRMLNNAWSVADPENKYGYIIEWEAARPDSTAFNTAPPDAVAWGQWRYKFFEESITYDEAFNRCANMGGKIFRIRSVENEQFILSNPQLGARITGAVWMPYEVYKGKLYGDTSSLNYIRWAGGSPPDFSSAHRLLWTRKGWTVADDRGAGSVKAGFICEWIEEK